MSRRILLPAPKPLSYVQTRRMCTFSLLNRLQRRPFNGKIAKIGFYTVEHVSPVSLASTLLEEEGLSPNSVTPMYMCGLTTRAVGGDVAVLGAHLGSCYLMGLWTGSSIGGGRERSVQMSCNAVYNSLYDHTSWVSTVDMLGPGFPAIRWFATSSQGFLRPRTVPDIAGGMTIESV
ncbi:uncharacterized protein LACBIDRAFT_331515 [Laccaria bicolor S238N-H82]|uniref:Predicted protein n=1 Tax=Laccaria bicolor (strain S238N-H82 / ATCC MYA-4686) TaxID=486041 RepID=B0DPP9_LACBS|nr:uncharacterized protein LACBIDRAFT_331515 [Laccaria bicolor S238N-H82]EDR03487.1 predicted protein [Laccaria bicolor S238N-H82]|eukprot:XP_001885943.1 predicted protein [Laccaria bicolor S238N-H82]